MSSSADSARSEREHADDCATHWDLAAECTCTRSEIAPEVRAILEDSLTERGMNQWWNARLRYLDGHTPAEWWPEHAREIIRAANAFTEGVYV